MDIKHCIENWDYTHYLAYMYVAIVNADYEVSEEELEELHNKLAYRVFGEESYQELYNEVIKVFKKQNDNQVYSCLTDLSKKYITSNEQKEKVLQDIHDIIESDGNESGSEHIMFMSIQKILANAI